MPIYEYKCGECRHAFEKLIRNATDLPEKCPACGKPALKKQFSAFAAKTASSSSCRNADMCAAAASQSEHRHSGGCCGSGRKCPL